MGRIFREFSITIVISILASGLVSLTLTPLMTSQAAEPSRYGREKNVDGARLRRHRASSARCLRAFACGSSFAIAGFPPSTWVVCLAGTAFFFYIVPKAFLPVGDSSFIRGVMVAQEGSSPDQMHAYQKPGRKNPEGQSRSAQHLHHERERHFPGSQSGILIAFLKDPVAARPNRQGSGAIDGQAHDARFPGPWPSCSRIRCSRSAPARPPTRRASSPTLFPASIPTRFTTTAGKMMAKMHEYPGFLFVNSDLLQPHAEPAG